MTLEFLQNEMIKGDKMRKDVLSSLVGAVKRAGIDNGCRDNIPESLVDTILVKEQKTMQEMIDTCPAEREEILTVYKAKMDIIKEFAPQLLTDPTEIKNTVEAILAEANIELIKKNKGVIMKTIMPKFKGKADMGVVNQVIGGLLA